MSDLDRRRNPRVPVNLPVELRDARGFSLYSSRDVSIGGIFFDRAIPHPLGSKVTVAFTLPGDDQQIVTQGEVANIPDEHSFGMGVRFLGLAEPERQKLQAFLDAQESK